MNNLYSIDHIHVTLQYKFVKYWNHRVYYLFLQRWIFDLLITESFQQNLLYNIKLLRSMYRKYEINKVIVELINVYQIMVNKMYYI